MRCREVSKGREAAPPEGFEGGTAQKACLVESRNDQHHPGNVVGRRLPESIVTVPPRPIAPASGAER
jgi:hypothetical protein